MSFFVTPNFARDSYEADADVVGYPDISQYETGANTPRYEGSARIWEKNKQTGKYQKTSPAEYRTRKLEYDEPLYTMYEGDRIKNRREVVGVHKIDSKTVKRTEAYDKAGIQSPWVYYVLNNRGNLSYKQALIDPQIRNGYKKWKATRQGIEYKNMYLDEKANINKKLGLKLKKHRKEKVPEEKIRRPRLKEYEEERPRFLEKYEGNRPIEEGEEYSVEGEEYPVDEDMIPESASTGQELAPLEDIRPKSRRGNRQEPSSLDYSKVREYLTRTGFFESPFPRYTQSEFNQANGEIITPDIVPSSAGIYEAPPPFGSSNKGRLIPRFGSYPGYEAYNEEEEGPRFEEIKEGKGRKKRGRSLVGGSIPMSKQFMVSTNGYTPQEYEIPQRSMGISNERMIRERYGIDIDPYTGQPVYYNPSTDPNYRGVDLNPANQKVLLPSPVPMPNFPFHEDRVPLGSRNPRERATEGTAAQVQLNRDAQYRSYYTNYPSKYENYEPEEYQPDYVQNSAGIVTEAEQYLPHKFYEYQLMEQEGPTYKGSAIFMPDRKPMKSILKKEPKYISEEEVDLGRDARHIAEETNSKDSRNKEYYETIENQTGGYAYGGNMNGEPDLGDTRFSGDITDNSDKISKIAKSLKDIKGIQHINPYSSLKF